MPQTFAAERTTPAVSSRVTVDWLVSRCASLKLTDAHPQLDERALRLTDPPDALRGHAEVPFRSTSSLCGRFADARRDPAPIFESLKSGVNAGKGYAATGCLLDFGRDGDAVGLVLIQPQHG